MMTAYKHSRFTICGMRLWFPGGDYCECHGSHVQCRDKEKGFTKLESELNRLYPGAIDDEFQERNGSTPKDVKDTAADSKTASSVEERD